jgi:acyl-CoA reductase-like NAD-dependent aldehyde dehydrogenase
VSRVILATREQAEEAIGGAVAAFSMTRKMPAYDRRRILE